jgi:hypothetical protein
MVFDQVVQLVFPEVSSPVRRLVGQNMTKYLTSIKQGSDLFFFLRVCIVGVLLKQTESDILNNACAKIVDALLEWTCLMEQEEKDALRQEDLVNCYTDSISVVLIIRYFKCFIAMLLLIG